MGVFGSKPVFSMKTDEQLWYEISENLDELSRREKVKYRVRATPESVKEKLKSLNLLWCILLAQYALLFLLLLYI